MFDKYNLGYSKRRKVITSIKTPPLEKWKLSDMTVIELVPKETAKHSMIEEVKQLDFEITETASDIEVKSNLSSKCHRKTATEIVFENNTFSKDEVAPSKEIKGKIDFS